MPKNWKTYKLEELTTKLGDGLHGTPKYSSDGDYFFINGNNLTDGRIQIKSNTKRVNEDQFLKYQKPLNNRTIFISINGTLGNVATYNNEKLVLGKSACYFNIKENVHKEFIKQYVSTASFKEFLENNATGSVIKNVSLKSMREHNIKLPPLPEQKAIAKILSAIDDKIENNLAINKTLEDMAMALYKHWFVDFGPFQDGEFIDSELGLIPKGWEVKRLDEISSMSAGGDKPKNFSKERADGLEIPIYSNGISNEGLYGFTDNARIFEESVTVSARGTIGYVCLRMQPYLPIVRLISLVPKKEYVSSKFLFLCLQNENIQGNGTTQQQLTVPDFKETKIITPNIDIIKDFNGIMDIAYNNIVSNKEENQSLTKLRDTLLSKLISGEVRLKEFREKVEQVL
jgi:type I restriction enzyme S subunit